MYQEKEIFFFNNKIGEFIRRYDRPELCIQFVDKEFLNAVTMALKKIQESRGQIMKESTFLVSDEIEFHIKLAQVELSSFINGVDYSIETLYDYFLHYKFNELNKENWFLRPSFRPTPEIYEILENAGVFEPMHLFHVTFLDSIDPYNNYYELSHVALRDALVILRMGKGVKLRTDIDKYNFNLICEKFQYSLEMGNLVIVKFYI